MIQLRGRRRRRGNAFVEVALVFVPLFGLLFGIIDFGYATFLRSTFQHAIREGVRYAVTYQLVSGKCHDASIKDVVQASAMGFLAGDTNLTKIKVRYFDPATMNEISPPSGNNPGNIVEVSIEGYEYRWLVPLFWPATPILLNVRTSDRMEGLPGGTSPPCR